MRRVLPFVPVLLLLGCFQQRLGEPEFDVESDTAGHTAAALCDPLMTAFPVAAAHNIGYDHSSCGSGTCAISCPDENANSDWIGDHHGIDVFAFHRAPLVAAADGVVTKAGWVMSTSGHETLRVAVADECGWEYWYGHADEVTVNVGDRVEAGELIGYMGNTGYTSTHLHFNISAWGNYRDDINPYPLLVATSPTACGAPPTPSDDAPAGEPSPAPEEPAEDDPADDRPDEVEHAVDACGVVGGLTILAPGDILGSCDGRFALLMQTDGNLVLYRIGHGALWHTQTHGHAGAWAAMQEDGNLVVYSAGGAALWSSGTWGHPGAVLAMQSDGNLVIYDGGEALWSSGTCCH